VRNVSPNRHRYRRHLDAGFVASCAWPDFVEPVWKQRSGGFVSRYSSRSNNGVARISNDQSPNQPTLSFQSPDLSMNICRDSDRSFRSIPALRARTNEQGPIHIAKSFVQVRVGVIAFSNGNAQS